jgi:hypothetical protein
VVVQEEHGGDVHARHHRNGSLRSPRVTSWQGIPWVL